MSSTRALRGRLVTQVALWVLVALLAGVAAWVLQTTGATSAVETLPAAGTHAGVGDSGSTQLLAGPSADRGATVHDGLAPSTARSYEPDDKNWLPAYRWGGRYSLDSSPVGLKNIETIGNKISSGLAALLFSLAGLLWGILLALVGWAFDLDVVEDRADWINTSSAAVATSLGSSGLIALVIVWVVISVGMAALKGGRASNNVVRNVVLFLVPIALMQVMVANVDAGADVDSQAGQLTPAGLAVRGSQVLNDISAAVAVPLTSMTSIDTYQEGAAKGAAKVPTCTYYYKRLYGTYQGVSAAGGEDRAAVALMLVSRLWESTMLRSYTEAQYGNVGEGRYAVCHLLERDRGTTEDAQAALVDVDGSPYKAAGLQLRDDGGKQSVFSTFVDAKAKFSVNWAWMACRNVDTEADPAWPNAMGGAKLDPEDCTAWAAGNWDEDGFNKDGAGPLQFKNPEEAAEELGGTSTKEFKVVNAYLGANADHRLVLSLVSLATAGAYLAALGGLALGTAVATILFAFLLIFAPLTLVLLALPSQNGKRNALGVKLLRMTGTTMAAKVTLYLFLLVTVALIDLLNGIAVGG